MFHSLHVFALGAFIVAFQFILFSVASNKYTELIFALEKSTKPMTDYLFNQ